MIVVLTYTSMEDDAAAHGESRSPFDGISVLGVYFTESLANEGIAIDQTNGVEGKQYMIVEPNTIHRHTVGA